MTGSAQSTIAPQTITIRALNDAFRKNLSGGRINVTIGVLEHTSGQIDALLRAVGEFNDFSDDNDPYGEHDFGSLTYLGQPLFWKIDYYDLEVTYGSPNPSDPEVTTRVLTIMMAWEY